MKAAISTLALSLVALSVWLFFPQHPQHPEPSTRRAPTHTFHSLRGTFAKGGRPRPMDILGKPWSGRCHMKNRPQPMAAALVMRRASGPLVSDGDKLELLVPFTPFKSADFYDLMSVGQIVASSAFRYPVVLAEDSITVMPATLPDGSRSSGGQLRIFDDLLVLVMGKPREITMRCHFSPSPRRMEEGGVSGDRVI